MYFFFTYSRFNFIYNFVPWVIHKAFSHVIKKILIILMCTQIVTRFYNFFLPIIYFLLHI